MMLSIFSCAIYISSLERRVIGLFVVTYTWTMNFQMFKLVLEKAEEPEIKLPASSGSWKRQESSRKTSISALKPLTVWITRNCGKFFKRWEYRITLSVFWETCMWVKSNLTCNNWLVQNWERSPSRLYVPCLFNLYAEYIMQNAKLDDSQAGIKMLGEISSSDI